MNKNIFAIIAFLLLVNNCFPQLRVGAFEEFQPKPSYLYKHHYEDKSGETYAIIDVIDEVAHNNLLIFQTNVKKPVVVEQLSRNQRLVFIHPSTKVLIITHPIDGMIYFDFPEPIKPGASYHLLLQAPDALIITGSQKNESDVFNNDEVIYIQNTFEESHNVAVYDKEGNQYSTGLFISLSGKAFVRIAIGNNGYEQYDLTESDKDDFSYMTTGESEIEPFYVK